MTDPQPIKKRRIRYRGTHPRRFEEKYKELNPQEYSDDVQKVIERGQTPAGTHRPICVNEIIDVLRLSPGQIGLDATLGYGGHTEQILPRILPGGKLIGIDVDPVELPRTEKRLRAKGFDQDQLLIKRMNFAGIPQLLTDAPEGFDFVVADLGVSSMQIDNPSRGFTFKSHGPLDLRLNPNRGKPASELIKERNTEELAEILKENSDEPHAALIARVVHAGRNDINSTSDLKSIIENAMTKHPPNEMKKTLQRVFQALRIEVNDEFGVLEQFLNLLPLCLKSGGRVAILTFHSGEDRRVKKIFQKNFRTGVFSQIAKDPIRPTASERRSNPRSTCAKLRWAVKS